MRRIGYMLLQIGSFTAPSLRIGQQQNACSFVLRTSGMRNIQFQFSSPPGTKYPLLTVLKNCNAGILFSLSSVPGQLTAVREYDILLSQIVESSQKKLNDHSEGRINFICLSKTAESTTVSAP